VWSNILSSIYLSIYLLSSIFGLVATDNILRFLPAMLEEVIPSVRPGSCYLWYNCLTRNTYIISEYATQGNSITRKPCCRKETARCRKCSFLLKFANNIHYKYKISQASKAATLQSSKHADA